MADRVHPSSKSNGTAAAVTPAANGAGTKSQPPRQPYRPQQLPQYNQSSRRRSRSFTCCCCCCWSFCLLMALAIFAAICGTGSYLYFRPQPPNFTVASLHVGRLNLTTAADSSSSHLSSLFNLTVAANNPNSHVTLFYDAFSVAFLTADGGVEIGNGTIPAFVSNTKNETAFRVVASASRDLDTEATTSLRSDLQRKAGVPMKIRMDTNVKVKLDSMKTKRFGIRVTCTGFKAVLPKGHASTVVPVAGAKCKVDLRIKIWKLTL